MTNVICAMLCKCSWGSAVQIGLSNGRRSATPIRALSSLEATLRPEYMERGEEGNGSAFNGAEEEGEDQQGQDEGGDDGEGPIALDGEGGDGDGNAHHGGQDQEV